MLLLLLLLLFLLLLFIFLLLFFLSATPLPGGGKQSSNILWAGRWPMQAGTHPADHPCVAQAEQAELFRARGYWLNPFPEGDGITLDPRNAQSAEQVVRDIKECFGWEVE